MRYPTVSAQALVELYVQIRDEIAGDECNLDPNHSLRAPIAMAILTAAGRVGGDIVAIEAYARQMLGQTGGRAPIAA